MHDCCKINLKRLIIAMIFLILSSAPSISGASLWPEDRRRILEFIQIGDCDNQWELLWDWAKKGNLQARNDLAISIAYNGLQPPLSKMPENLYKRSMFEILIYGSVYEIDILRPLLDNEAIEKNGFVNVASIIQCMKSQESRGRCIDDAVKAGELHDFNTLSAIIDRFASSEDAGCRRLN